MIILATSICNVRMRRGWGEGDIIQYEHAALRKSNCMPIVAVSIILPKGKFSKKKRYPLPKPSSGYALFPVDFPAS